MSFKDPIIYAILSLALLLLSANSLVGLRLHLFTAINLVFITLIFNFSAQSLALITIFLLINYLAIRLMIFSSRQFIRSTIFWIWIILSLSIFIIVKEYQWITDLVYKQSFIPATLVTVGLSFIFFRQLSLSIEIRDRALNEVNFIEYINYNCAFWTFVAGPLQRFESFRSEIIRLTQGERVETKDVLQGLNRAAFGFLKMFVVANEVNKYATVEKFINNPSLITLVIFLLAFPIYLYVNFSGYCDIVIGIARAIGFKLPENFNHPYMARNLNDFWTRWHITLSSLLRDYLYFPIQTNLARYIPLLMSMIIACLLSFLIMGIWHGNSVYFSVFGLLHGIGIVIVNLYTEGLKKILNKKELKAYKENRLIKISSIIICQCYIIFTFLPFNYDIIELNQVIKSLTLING